jgi:hypothetical protein
MSGRRDRTYTSFEDRDSRLWHFCDVSARPRCGRYQGESGRSRVSAAMLLVVVSFPPNLHVLRSLANMAH